MRAHVIEDQKIVNTIEVESLDAPLGMQLIDASVGGQIGDGYVNGKVVPAAPPPAPAPPVRRMTVLAFRNRFTAAEKAAIELGAVHDPYATAALQMRAATIRAYLADLLAAKHVEPDRPETRGGAEVLEHWGFLANGRAVAILDAPIQDSEKP